MSVTQDASEHQRLIDHIKTEMGAGGPEVVHDDDSVVAFRTLARKEETITILADDVGYEVEAVDDTVADRGFDAEIEIAFTPAEGE